MASLVYCKVDAIDGVHFVKVEKEKFTFEWLQQNYIKPKHKMETFLAYDDLSGDRVLLTNEEEFELMVDTMVDIGANMVKLYVTKKRKRAVSEGKRSKPRELIRGGSFGIFSAKCLAGFDKIEKTSNADMISKKLVTAYKTHLELNHAIPLDVAEIHAKRINGTVKVVCIGKIGHSDLDIVYDKLLLRQLEDEPQKCAWIDNEKYEAYIFQFETEKDAAEFCRRISEMTARPI